MGCYGNHALTNLHMARISIFIEDIFLLLLRGQNEQVGTHENLSCGQR